MTITSHRNKINIKYTQVLHAVGRATTNWMTIMLMACYPI